MQVQLTLVFRVPRTVEEESALVSEARPSSTKYKDKWAVGIFHEWQRTRTLEFPDLGFRHL